VHDQFSVTAFNNLLERAGEWRPEPNRKSPIMHVSSGLPQDATGLRGIKQTPLTTKRP